MLYIKLCYLLNTNFPMSFCLTLLPGGGSSGATLDGDCGSGETYGGSQGRGVGKLTTG